MANEEAFISFPEGYLGSRPARFPLLVNDDELFCLNKPAGMACFQHGWTQGRPDFTAALRRELLNRKPQLERLGLEGIFRIYNLEAEVSGALLYAKTEAAEGRWRNVFGSRQIEFTYHLLAETEAPERELACDLPVAAHFNEDRALVSHATGKKCETRFRYLRAYGRFQLWEAKTRDMRLHQVRLHAAELGLRILGDRLYGGAPPIYLSSLKRGYRGDRERERPIYDGLCLHLLSLAFEAPGVCREPIHAPLPERFATLLKRLEDAGGMG